MKHTSRIFARMYLLLIFVNVIPAGMSQTGGPRAQTNASRPIHSDAASSVFGVAQGHSSGLGIGQAVTADFNGDGVPDLAVVSCNSNFCDRGNASVAILIGNGDGSFQPPAAYATGAYGPMSVAVGDVNADGVPDLVVASQCASSGNCTTGQVSVLLGNGDGTFKSPVPYSIGLGNSYFVAVADFNGDGKLDLAVANRTAADSVVAILLGKGDGTFQAPVSYSTGAPSAVFLAVADFNNDGALDLAVANSEADSVSILLGDGNGAFRTAAVYASGGALANSIAVGDFNADGTPDLAVVNGCATYYNLTCSPSGSVGVLLGNGDGTFQPPVAYGSGGNTANFVAVADFNGDGIPDLAVANQGPSAAGGAGVLGLLLGNGDGAFQPAVTFDSGGSLAASVSVGNFNGDGQPDLAVVNECDNRWNCANGAVGVLLNSTSNFSLFTSGTSLTSSVNPAAAGQAVLFTATVVPGFDHGAPSGSITFFGGATTLGTVAISDGQAAYPALFMLPGPQAIQAAYSGDANYAASFSPILTETVGTPVTLVSSRNPSAAGQAVTFTAAAGAGRTPTGSVTFMAGAIPLGIKQLVNGSASVSLPALPAGNRPITASYSADTNLQPGFTAMTQAVSQTTMTVLRALPDPASDNQLIDFTATVTGQDGSNAVGAVAFMQGSPATTWGTAQLVNGTASISNAFSQSGTYPITAVFLGSPNYQTSSSAALKEVVSGTQNVKTTTTIVSSGTPSILNQPVTFTATVATSSSTIPNGELVTFYNGTNTLGSAATANGLAALTVSSLPLGHNSITAAYPGDDVYISSTSRAFAQIVQLTPTIIILTSNLNPSSYGQSVTFSVSAAPVSGQGTPTGTVTLKNGAIPFGNITLSNGAGSLTTSSLAAGSLSITASYSGDANFGNNSATLFQVVNLAPTSTTLTSKQNPSALNQSVTFTATLNGQYGGTPGGIVTFTQGASNLGNAALIRGKATITYAFPATGTYPVVATYFGDASDSASASPAVNQLVGTISTSITLTSSGSPAFAGQSITFTASVTPASGGIPDGETVNYYNGPAAIGTGATQNGIATLATSALPVGTGSITATYAGDATYQSGTSKIFRQVVSLNTSVTTMVSSANPAVYGQAVTLTATIAPASGSGVPTGKVIFKNGGNIIGSAPLVNGSATFTPSLLVAGSLPLTASYSGDANFAASSATMTQTVSQAVTATALTSNPNPSSLGQTTTFTAMVTAAYQGSITGSVSFMNGSTTLGSVPISKGKATFSNVFSVTGTDSISAVYTGDANNGASSSVVLNQVVNNGPTTTTVSSSGTPALAGQPVTFTATVTSSYGPIPDGELVTFYDSAGSIGAGNTKGGAAAMTTSSLSPGIYNITATYAGDSSFQSSTSKIFKQTIRADATVTLLTSNANPSAYWQPVMLTATVTATGLTPAGTVAFKNGAATLGIATLNPQGMATLTTLTLDAGVYPITATYNGGMSWAKSTSAVLNQAVNPAATNTQLISSVNPAALGESVTFTAIVRSATAFATGSVTFTAGSAVLGAGTLVNGIAKLAVATLPAGATTVMATYSGSANVAGSAASMIENVE